MSKKDEKETKKNQDKLALFEKLSKKLFTELYEGSEAFNIPKRNTINLSEILNLVKEEENEIEKKNVEKKKVPKSFIPKKRNKKKKEKTVISKKRLGNFEKKFNTLFAEEKISIVKSPTKKSSKNAEKKPKHKIVKKLSSPQKKIMQRQSLPQKTVKINMEKMKKFEMIFNELFGDEGKPLDSPEVSVKTGVISASRKIRKRNFNFRRQTINTAELKQYEEVKVKIEIDDKKKKKSGRKKKSGKFLSTFTLKEEESEEFFGNRGCFWMIQNICSWFNLFELHSSICKVSRTLRFIAEGSMMQYSIENYSDFELHFKDYEINEDLLLMILVNNIVKPRFYSVIFLLSCQNQFDKVVGFMLKLSNGFNPTYNNHEAFISAVKNNHFSTVKILVRDERIDPEVNGQEAMATACRNGYYEISKLLLDLIDPTFDNNLFIRLACEFEREDIVKLLRRNDLVNPADMNDIAIREAIKRGNFLIVEEMLGDSRVNPAGSEYAMYCLQQLGDIKKIELTLLLLQIRKKFLNNRIWENTLKEIKQFGEDRKKLINKLIPKHNIVKEDIYSVNKLLISCKNNEQKRSIDVLKMQKKKYDSKFVAKLVKLDHANLVDVYGAVKHADHYFLFSEIPNNTLYNFILEKSFQVFVDINLLIQVSNGMVDLYKNDLFHFNLNCSSIYLQETEEEIEKVVFIEEEKEEEEEEGEEDEDDDERPLVRKVIKVKKKKRKVRISNFFNFGNKIPNFTNDHVYGIAPEQIDKRLFESVEKIDMEQILK